jgi:predicted AlkP superfamily pyrophosphatase or phosphodiesterase
MRAKTLLATQPKVARASSMQGRRRALAKAVAGAFFAALLAVPALPTGAPETVAPAAPQLPAIRLLVLVVVDQLAWDTLERARPALRGGLGRLLAESVEVRHAEHRHGITSTSPGHGTLVTGLEPRHHGLIANDWYDRSRGKQVWAHQDPDSGVFGPAQLLASGLGDWIRDRDPRAKSFALSAKHRGAVVTGGRRPNGAFWFDPAVPGFVSSAAYPPEPEWLPKSPQHEAIRARFGTPWLAAPLPEGVDPAALGFVQLEGTNLPRPFPHAMGDAVPFATTGFFNALSETPLIDEHVAALAEELIVRERLGKDEALDFLGVSFASFDDVGHEYGQHSLEALDALIRLDRVLGALLDRVDHEVGREHVVVVLSADHGAPPMPERQRLVGGPGERKTPEAIACVQRIPQQLDATFGPHRWFESAFYLDDDEVARSGVPRAEIERRVAAWLADCPGVTRAWTRGELEAPVPAGESEPWRERYRASFHPQRSPDFLVQPDLFYMDRLRAVTHKTPYEYDAHVPLLLRLPGVAPRMVDEPVATTDVAPTLAALLGLRPETAPDGRDLSALLLRPR